MRDSIAGNKKWEKYITLKNVSSHMVIDSQKGLKIVEKENHFLDMVRRFLPSHKIWR